MLCLVLLIPGVTGKFLRWGAAVCLAAGMIFKLADMATYQVFARPFNPIFDAYLLVNGMHLLNGALGKFKALIFLLLLVAFAVSLILLTFWALGRIASALGSAPRYANKILLAGFVLASVFLWLGWERVVVRFSDLMATHWSDTLASLHELKNFRQQVDLDTATKISNEHLFTKLKGKDVLLVFIESYGRTVLERPEFAEHMQPLLQTANEKLNANGFSARSAYLTSPTFGGLSWLAHGTTLSGLWINSQVRYDGLIMSQRESLNRLFKRAGWRTAAVMPAISMAWPEGKYFGYDQIYAARDLGYKGKPFNWVTMPDQYTLAAFQARERQPGHAPVMTEIALISSHAPWTPVPRLVDWNQVGDGRIFNSQAESGDAPDVVWQDTDRIRDQYRQSIEYALSTLVSYATTYGDDNLVILALGDHQPAPIVTGSTQNRDVIVHLIARDPKIMEAVTEWKWSDGMLPAAKAPVWRMDEVRDRLIETFSSSMSQ